MGSAGESVVQQGEPSAAAPKESVRLKVRARSGKRLLYVQVSPSLGKRNWPFLVQEFVSGEWVAHQTHSTVGRSEVTRVHLGRGTYCVVVLDRHGLLGATSGPVWLRR